MAVDKMKAIMNIENLTTLEELENFINFHITSLPQNSLNLNPTAGDVIPNADGARKVRWTVKGTGKRGGVRVVYFNQDAEGLIYLIAIYQKSDKTNITGKEIKQAT